MMNPNALPQSATLQDFQQFGNDISSPDYNDTLNAMQYMQAQRQPQGLMGLPQVSQPTVPMQEGGGMEEAMMQEQMMQQQAPQEAMMQQPQVSPQEEMALQQEMGQRQEGAMQAEQQLENIPPEAREQYEREVAELQEAAQGIASLGREGDNLLVHMNPEELEGLSSLGNITYNPITGLPEAFGIKKFFKKVTSIPRGIVKGVKRIAKSKAFRTIAPIALAIAAPYALGALAPTVFGAGATFAGGALGAGTALGAAATTGIGSLIGGLASGQKFGDAAKGALLSGATAGLIQGGSNVIGGKGFQSGIKKFDGPVGLEHGAKTVAASQKAGANVNVASGGKSAFKELPTTLQQNAVNLGNAPANVASTGAKPLIQLEGAGQRFVNIAKDDLVRDNLLKTGTRVGTKILAADLATTNPNEFLPQDIPQEGEGQERIVQPEYNPIKQVAYSGEGGYGNYGGDLTEEDILRLRTTGGMGNILGRTMFRNAAEGDIASFGKSVIDKKFAKEGGLIELAGGGEFSGMVPGQGGGMEDNVYMPIKEGPEQVGTLAVSPSEYVVDSYTMAALGNGNPAEGARVMDDTIKQVRKKAYGSMQQPNEINGLSALRPMAQGV